MLALHGTSPAWEQDARKMGDYLNNSFEASAVSVGSIKASVLQPSEPVFVSLPETGTSLHGEGKNATKTAIDAVTASCAAEDGSKARTRDLEAAKEAVLFMGIPETLVQLIIDMEPLEPTLRFTNAEQLYQLASDLAGDPKRQEDLNAKRQQQVAEAAFTKAAEANKDQGGVLSAASPAAAAAEAEGDRQKSLAGMPEGSRRSASTAGPASSAATTSLMTSTSLPLLLLQENRGGQEEAACGEAGQPGPGDREPGCSKAKLQKRVRRLAEENQRLNHRKMCRACKKVELASSGVTFLPCGHFVTCEPCSEKFDDCPSCGKVIMGTVRTFLS